MGRAPSGVDRADPSSETGTREARARAWLYIFNCYERKKADAGNMACIGKEAKGDKDDRGENVT